MNNFDTYTYTRSTCTCDVCHDPRSWRIIRNLGFRISFLLLDTIHTSLKNITNLSSNYPTEILQHTSLKKSNSIRKTINKHFSHDQITDTYSLKTKDQRIFVKFDESTIGGDTEEEVDQKSKLIRNSKLQTKKDKQADTDKYKEKETSNIDLNTTSTQSDYYEDVSRRIRKRGHILGQRPLSTPILKPPRSFTDEIDPLSGKRSNSLTRNSSKSSINQNVPSVPNVQITKPTSSKYIQDKDQMFQIQPQKELTEQKFIRQDEDQNPKISEKITKNPKINLSRKSSTKSTHSEFNEELDMPLANTINLMPQNDMSVNSVSDEKNYEERLIN